jgi:hypothetical protein
MENSTGILQRFLTDYLIFAESDSEDNIGLWEPSKMVGLCSNMECYCYANGVDYSTRRRAEELLHKLFELAGLDKDFPFNNGNGQAYMNERECHKNPERLAWAKRIRDKLKGYNRYDN